LNRIENFIFIFYFAEAVSEKAGQLYTLKATISQEALTKPAPLAKPKVVCNTFCAVFTFYQNTLL
jgi:hypothetical protein